jgi:hypothetical protein
LLCGYQRKGIVVEIIGIACCPVLEIRSDKTGDAYKGSNNGEAE